MLVYDLDLYMVPAYPPYPFVAAELTDPRAEFPEYRLVAAGGLRPYLLELAGIGKFVARGEQPDRDTRSGPWVLYNPVKKSSPPPKSLVLGGTAVPVHISPDGRLFRAALLLNRLSLLPPENDPRKLSAPMRRAVCEMDSEATAVSHSVRYPSEVRYAVDAERIQCLRRHRQSIPEFFRLGLPDLPHISPSVE